jgi:nitrate/nitrite transporter NarK
VVVTDAAAGDIGAAVVEFVVVVVVVALLCVVALSSLSLVVIVALDVTAVSQVILMSLALSFPLLFLVSSDDCVVDVIVVTIIVDRHATAQY